MVKLQKSLTKPMTLVDKKKRKLPSPPLAGISKQSIKKDTQKGGPEKAKEPKKEKLLKAIINDDKTVATVKTKTKDAKSTTTTQLQEIPLKDVQKKKQKTVKKPLVPANVKNETNSKSKKRPLVLAPPASPAAEKTADTVSSKKSKKLKKKQKKSTGGTEQLTPITNLKKKSAAKRAYKKQQIKLKREGKTKTKKAPKKLYEALPFDEAKFNAIVSEDNIMKIAKGLKKQVEKEVSAKKTAIFSDFQYFLNVSCFKIPNAPKRVVKLNLKHSLVDKDDDVAIVVCDLQRGAKVDYDPTIQHYEDLFREAGVEGLTIIPFNKLRNECKTFETVRKFGNTYDYFLCDGRLVGHASGFCGKVFQKPRTTFHTVRMDNQKNLKREIEKSLSRTAYKQVNKGDMISIPIGSHKFEPEQIAENVMFVMEQLKKSYPGGFPNIRGMYLKIGLAGTSALPIYVSVAEAPADTPNVIGPREKRMLKLKREANEVLTNFNITKQGDLNKLSKSETNRKRKLKEMRAAIDTTDKIVIHTAGSTDGKQSVVPAKKSKTEKNVSSSSGKTEKEKEKEIQKEGDDEAESDEGEAEQEGEDEHGSDEDDSDDEDGDEDNDGNDDSEDDEDEDDEDDDEEAGDDSSDNEDSEDNDEEDDAE